MPLASCGLTSLTEFSPTPRLAKNPVPRCKTAKRRMSGRYVDATKGKDSGNTCYTPRPKMAGKKLQQTGIVPWFAEGRVGEPRCVAVTGN